MADEGCDDGDKNDGLGCEPDCSAALYGWYCVNGDENNIDDCHTECDDGLFAPETEECSDTNLANGDGCDSNCQVESGYDCDTSEPKSICITDCGDGVIAGIEVCDDGDELYGEGCRGDCSGDLIGWYCNAASPSVCNSI